MPKEFKALLKVIGAPFSIAATAIILVAIPFIKVAKLLGHKYWQW